MSAAAWVFLFAAVAGWVFVAITGYGAQEQKRDLERRLARMAANNLKLRGQMLTSPISAHDVTAALEASSIDDEWRAIAGGNWETP